MPEKLTVLLGFLLALSLATERLTEAIKGVPLLSLWFASEKEGSTWEECRKASIQVLAIAIGTFLAYSTRDQLATALGITATGYWVYLLFGAMASGGSGLWNSTLDIVRQVNKAKEAVREEAKARALAAGSGKK